MSRHGLVRQNLSTQVANGAAEPVGGHNPLPLTGLGESHRETFWMNN